MTYEEFQEYVRAKCVYTAIYLDGEGREILVIPMLDAFAMVNAAPKRPWVGLTGTEINHIFSANVGYPERMMKEVETLLKDKNT